MSAPDEPLMIAGGSCSPGVTAEVAGSKAALLWRMAALGLDVPPAFVMPTSLCKPINDGDHSALESLERGLKRGIAWLEQATGLGFGDARTPLLVSVRSGAAVSMPGMLDTVLNIGLNEDTVHGFIRMKGNPRLAFDSFRRMIQGYAETVERIPGSVFENALMDLQKRENVATEIDLDPEALERLAAEFRELTSGRSGKPLPHAPFEQLRQAALAVYRSWESPRAHEYRRLNHLQEIDGTAVTVQAMVFGNSGAASGAGVAFSRNPATGKPGLYVDFLFDAQGEDVVSGRRTPNNSKGLDERLPNAARKLDEGIGLLEREFRDMQDVEFTIEEGRLYFLQSRTAKRSPLAHLRVAVDMVQEGLIDVPTALVRLGKLDPALLTVARFAEPAEPVALAIPASPGVAAGRVAFDVAQAHKLAAEGHPVILVRKDTSTDDVEGFALSAGILTAVGGRTAHAAVVARQLGKVCLVGCRSLNIDEERRQAHLADSLVREGDWLSLDGERGEITLGKRDIVADAPPELKVVEQWKAENENRPMAVA